MGPPNPVPDVGGRMFVATAVALLLGYLWACVDCNRSPLDPVRFLWDRPPETVRQPLKGNPKTPDLPRPALLTAEEMSLRFASIDESLAHGRIPEAQEKVRSIDRLLVPEPSMDRVRGYERRIDRYMALLQETSRGGLVERPRLWALRVKGRAPRIVRVQSREKGLICYETLAGGRSSLGESEVESLEPLEDAAAHAESAGELAQRAAAEGIEMAGGPGGPHSYGEKAGRAVRGLVFFDLADFCARNGLNEEVVALFDEGLKRDADLLRTVREARAGRWVDAYLYFMAIEAREDARLTLAILEDRYADTEAYKERILKNPGRKKEGRGGQVPVPPGKADELIARGDRYFNEAMTCLQRPDRAGDPSGGAIENARALELLLKANGEGYLPAQEMFPKGEVPQRLLDRVRETLKLISDLRKTGLMK